MMEKFLKFMALPALLLTCASPACAVEDDGRALLEKRCGRCHAVAAGMKSRIKAAPNLWDKLRSYPSDRLEFELSEGIGSRHLAMPQIQFTSEEIASVQAYLAGD